MNVPILVSILGWGRVPLPVRWIRPYCALAETAALRLACPWVSQSLVVHCSLQLC